MGSEELSECRESPSIKPITSSAMGSLASTMAANSLILFKSGNSTRANGWFLNLLGIRFSNLRIDREQTDGVIPKIRQRCLIFIVLPIQNRKRPSSAVGNNNLGLPLFLLAIHCEVSWT